MTTVLTKIKLPRLRVKQHSLERQVDKAMKVAALYCFSQLTAAEDWVDYQPREALQDEFVDVFKTVILRDEAQRFAIMFAKQHSGESKKVFVMSGTYSPLVIGGHRGMPARLKQVISELEGHMKGVTWPRSSVLRIEVYPTALRVCVRDKSDATNLSERVLYPKWRIID